MPVSTDTFYLKKAEPNRSCLLELRAIILNQDNAITETIKYGMPCFCFQKKPLCYLWTDKKTFEPYILFVDGKLIEHPKLEQGERSRMKIFRVNPNQDIAIRTIRGLLRKAINLRGILT